MHGESVILYINIIIDPVDMQGKPNEHRSISISHNTPWRDLAGIHV